MNILLVETYYYHRGGASVYILALAQMLMERGHNPIPFAMHSPENLPTEYDKYFVSHIDFSEELQKVSLSNAAKILKRIFHFPQAGNNIKNLLEDVPIHLVHLNNFFHHLSLSIIEPIRSRNIPIVWTLHDHILVCPNTYLFNDEIRMPCRDCTGMMKRLFLPMLKRCKKGSFTASALASLEAMYIHARKPYAIPEFFIAPSEFLKNQHRAMGFDVSRFEVVPNFVDCSAFEPRTKPGDYVLYFGRLSREKGLERLIEAFTSLGNRKLVIAGVGPDEKRLRTLAEKLGAPVHFAGFNTGESLKQLIYQSRFTVMPSMCYENAPLAILESLAAGKPVIASDIGGIPELVTGDIGLLFPPGNADAIAEAVETLWNDKSRIEDMGKIARKTAEDKYTPEIHLEKILNIYSRAMKK